MPSLATPSHPLPDSAIPEHIPNLADRIPKLIPRKTAPKQQRQPRTTAAPETPSLPAPAESTDGISYSHPTRRILSEHDLDLFLSSSTYTLITAFLFTITDAVQDVPVSAVASQSLHPTVTSLLAILDSAQQALDRNPPKDTGSRFGNPIFKDFVAAVQEEAAALHKKHFPGLPEGAMDELTTYFTSSFGSGERIDYGSGHELNYFMYLLVLNRLSLLPQSTFASLALVLFPRYLELMRNLQTAYYLEPAGSHGVWGLDDYHFLPFLFGASQLTGHAFIRPLAIHSEATIEAYAGDYLYLDMVRQVNATKTVQGLRWHSPMLDDISGVREGWGKIGGGMRKMLVREVLGKLVVMQHFLFGGVLPAAAGTTPAAEVEAAAAAAGDSEHSHGHAHAADGTSGAGTWGDCCGIAVPSSVGAREEMRKRLAGGSGGGAGGQTLRRLPFD